MYTLVFTASTIDASDAIAPMILQKDTSTSAPLALTDKEIPASGTVIVPEFLTSVVPPDTTPVVVRVVNSTDIPSSLPIVTEYFVNNRTIGLPEGYPFGFSTETKEGLCKTRSYNYIIRASTPPAVMVWQKIQEIERKRITRLPNYWWLALFAVFRSIPPSVIELARQLSTPTPKMVEIAFESILPPYLPAQLRQFIVDYVYVVRECRNQPKALETLLDWPYRRAVERGYIAPSEASQNELRRWTGRQPNYSPTILHIPSATVPGVVLDMRFIAHAYIYIHTVVSGAGRIAANGWVCDDPNADIPTVTPVLFLFPPEAGAEVAVKTRKWVRSIAVPIRRGVKIMLEPLNVDILFDERQLLMPEMALGFSGVATPKPARLVFDTGE